MAKPTRKCGTVAAYRRGCRCGECKAASASAMREYRTRREDQGRPLPRYGSGKHLVSCDVCGTQVEKYYASKSRRQVCSDRCRYFLRWGKFPPGNELVHVGPAPEPVAPPAPVTVVTAGRYWGAITSGPCNWCGEQFTALSGLALYCSKRCRSQATKSRRDETFQPSPILRRAIYERDDWTCQLCFDPVDPDADPLSDWFPSLDHIVPQSHMLIPDHSPENLRTAHRWCNAVRGDGTYHADLFEEAS